MLASIFRQSTAALIHTRQKRMHIQCMDTNDDNSAKTEPFSGEPAITSTSFFVLLFYYTKYTIQKQAIPLPFRSFPFKNRCIRQLLFVSTTCISDWLLILPTTGIRFSGDQSFLACHRQHRQPLTVEGVVANRVLRHRLWPLEDHIQLMYAL